MRCLSCQSDFFYRFDDFQKLKRITSDVKTFADKGELYCCNQCALIQKKITKKLIDEISQIYQSYTPYHYGNGEEQYVLLKDQTFVSRSGYLFRLVNKFIDVAHINELLDIGCGNGVTLKLFNEKEINLYGHEYSTNNEEYLQNISDFKKLYTSSLDLIKKKFDVVLLIHTLEHFTDPLNELTNIKKLMHENSFLFIQVVDNDFNEFDILTADHITHFSKSTLFNMLVNAGFFVEYIDNDVTKEITLVAKINTNSVEQQKLPINSNITINETKKIIEKHIHNSITYSKINKDISIFGTSISSIWAYNHLKKTKRVCFFLDEDPAKIGNQIDKINIIHPNDFDYENSMVLIPLATSIRKIIMEKYKKFNFYE